MKNPSVRDMKAQVGEPRIMAVCHREPCNRGVSVSSSMRELGSPTSLVEYNTLHRVYKFPAFLDPRSRVPISTLATENIDRVEHHHVRSLGLLQILVTPDFVE